VTRSSTRERFPGPRHLSLLLVVTLLLCRGAFGGLHMVCHLPECAGHQEHAAGHHAADGGLGDAHEHQAGHETSSEYFAVLVALLALLLRLPPKIAPSRVGLGMPWAAPISLLAAAFRPPPPKPPNSQVFRL
jgi:hypothetical protein